jgi:hypothetical protein
MGLLPMVKNKTMSENLSNIPQPKNASEGENNSLKKLETLNAISKQFY